MRVCVYIYIVVNFANAKMLLGRILFMVNEIWEKAWWKRSEDGESYDCKFGTGGSCRRVF